MNFDVYEFHTRLMPAALVALPALVGGLAALPLLSGAAMLWPLVTLAVPAFAAALARRAGNDVQPSLIETWGGLPTTDMLRFGSRTPEAEVLRRHRRLREVLGSDVDLPTKQEELDAPAAADLRYEVVVRRAIAILRGNAAADLHLVNKENRHYGFARNLYGLKRLALIVAIVTLTASAALGWILWAYGGAPPVILIAPAATSLIAIIAWTFFINPKLVQRPATAYAERFIEAIDRLQDQNQVGL